jgi:cytoskeletal protein RodZ
LALFSGGLLPIISLTFAHMLVVYSNREEQLTTLTPVIDLEEVSRQAGLIEKQNQEITNKNQEKKKKENTTIIVLVSVLLVIGIVGFIIWKKYKK